MNVTRLLLKAKMLVQNPPSETRVKLVLGVIVICLILVGIEKVFGWPQWATVDKLRGFRS